MNNHFSFHCTICYEALDSTERAPVVLPCGHTFICQQCSSRLDKCMECRHPLFASVQGEKADISDYQENFHEARPRQQRRNSLPSVLSSPPATNISPTFEAEKKPLPMPKNFVLISLMESSRWSERDNSKEDKAFENHDDDTFVSQGVEQLNSDFGTYAVCEREGLAICESITNEDNKATLLNEESSEKKQKEDSKEDLNQSMDLSDAFDLRSVIITQDSFDFVGHMSTEIKLVDSDDDQEKLPYGRTVQVVNIEDGHASLARGAGSLQVKPGQLVKVGAARDKACQIEGRMLSLKKQREEMKQKMKDMEREISILSKKLPQATAVPFIDSANVKSDSEDEAAIFPWEQRRDDASIATTATISTTASNDIHLSLTDSFTCDAINLYTSPRQQMDQETAIQSQSAPSTPVRHSPRTPITPTRRAAGVDFNSGFSGYGFSSHRSPPRRQPRRQIRRLSAY